MDSKVVEVLTRLEKRDQEERARGLPGSQRIQSIHPDSAHLLYLLALAKGAKSIVEVGMSHGYSTLWLASAARINGGKVVAHDINPERIAAARRNFDEAGLADWIEIVEGDVHQTLRGRAEPVDLLFIDISGKSDYRVVFDLVYPRLVRGGLVVADNALSHPDQLADYISYLQNHPDLASATIPTGRGLEVTVRLA
jgi:predicted O-methyltransferase YrrM